MTSHAKLRKEKGGPVDYDTQIKEVRCQLVEQLKVLDLQLEQKSQQLQDLTDYVRRRGEIESEYARSLDKLAERFTSRTKRKEPSNNSVAQVWLALLSQTRQEARDHNGLSESCSNFLIHPLTHCLEYTQRLAKKSKDICTHLQDGLIQVTTELQTAWRTYHQYQSEYVCAEGKLKEAEKQEEKQKQSAAKKQERLIEKRQRKVQDLHLKCSKARNDYLLNLAAANGSMSKYYLNDISTLIDCADTGYHPSVERVMRAYLSGRLQAQQNLSTGLQQLQVTVSGLDQNQDRDTLLKDHNSSFCLPFRFLYQPHDGDQVSEVSAECELENRFNHIQTRLKDVTQETLEAEEGMAATKLSLLESINNDDLEPSSGSGTGPSQEAGSENVVAKPSVARRRATMQETETLYFTKVKDYLVRSSIVSTLQAKHDLLKVAVEKAGASNDREPGQNGKSVCVRRDQSHPSLTYDHKLFGGDMLSFIQASGQQIPVVVKSCIRFINLNGLQHEGIFRVSGSQMEVNKLRDAFEQGEDPLAQQKCDLDSVAGVLKLYFRGLENPLFPVHSTNQLLEFVQIDQEADRAAQLKAVVSSFAIPAIVVMRYLFAFLHHVSQYSDENMMEPYNLAVCFGPTLLRGAQDEDDVVSLQAQINAVVKTMIVQHESIFPGQAEVPGPVYEKCMTLEQDDSDPIAEEADGEAEGSHGKDEMESGSSADSISSLSGLTHKKSVRLRAHSSGSSDQVKCRVGAAGGSITPAGKLLLQLPMGPQGRRGQSPNFVRRPAQEYVSHEDTTVKVDKEVCRQMDFVFKELLTRQAQDPSSASSAASSTSTQDAQRKGRREGVRGRGAGLFRGGAPLD